MARFRLVYKRHPCVIWRYIDRLPPIMIIIVDSIVVKLTRKLG